METERRRRGAHQRTPSTAPSRSRRGGGDRAGGAAARAAAGERPGATSISTAPSSTPTAESTLNDIIADIQGRELGGITVAGHTDTAGPPDYNMQLSERRANNVAAELIKAGIPATIVTTEAFGETELAVETPDNTPAAAQPPRDDRLRSARPDRPYPVARPSRAPSREGLVVSAGLTPDHARMRARSRCGSSQLRRESSCRRHRQASKRTVELRAGVFHDPQVCSSVSAGAFALVLVCGRRRRGAGGGDLRLGSGPGLQHAAPTRPTSRCCRRAPPRACLHRADLRLPRGRAAADRPDRARGAGAPRGAAGERRDLLRARPAPPQRRGRGHPRRRSSTTSRAAQLGGITVAGHTDTSGAADYNMRLSQRRANTVATELIQAGVPAQLISADGYGQTDLAVPTADGVVLAANRRVVVDFAP